MNVNPRFVCLTTTMAVLLLAGAANAVAQDRTFVSIAAIPGDSTDTGHLNWIDAYALDTGVVSPAGGGAAQFSDVAFLKGPDKATPHLHDAIAVGVVYPLAIIEVCRPGTPAQQCYYRVELTNASVSGVSLSGSSCVGSGACTPTQTESVSFRYTKIKWIYTPFTGGTPGTPVQRCFDLVTRTRC